MLTPANPLPLLGAIVTGVGFLGAGALIKSGDKVYGFTTAALIWIFTIPSAVKVPAPLPRAIAPVDVRQMLSVIAPSTLEGSDSNRQSNYHRMI